MRRLATRSALALLLLSTAAHAQTTTQPSATAADRAKKVIDKAQAYLKAQQQPDGSWPAPRGALAISALVVKGFAQNPATHDSDITKKGFAYILSAQNEDGGIYKDPLACYTTAICISTLASAHNPEYKPRIDKAVAYLRRLQWSDTMEGLPKGDRPSPNDPQIGGWGYGSKSRPDMSNTHFALTALKDAGVSQDDPMFKKAAEFATRCQNLPSSGRANAKSDGGFIYSVHDGGESMAGSSTDESGTKRFNSYGSMTYAGLKSLIYAGINKQDPRVVAAWQWISTNWSVSENPGMSGAGPDHAQDGLYYYYVVLGRTLKEYGEPAVPAKTGSVDWRVQLINQLENTQSPDGSWTGSKAFMETNPTLVTSYSILALQEALESLQQTPPVK